MHISYEVFIRINKSKNLNLKVIFDMKISLAILGIIGQVIIGMLLKWGGGYLWLKPPHHLAYFFFIQSICIIPYRRSGKKPKRLENEPLQALLFTHIS